MPLTENWPFSVRRDYSRRKRNREEGEKAECFSVPYPLVIPHSQRERGKKKRSGKLKINS